jgi:hypothetical protein
LDIADCGLQTGDWLTVFFPQLIQNHKNQRLFFGD